MSAAPRIGSGWFRSGIGPAFNRKSVLETNGHFVENTYDVLYRPTEEDLTDPDQGPETIRYAYDVFGNRLTKTDSAGAGSYTYNPSSVDNRIRLWLYSLVRI